MSVTNLQLSSSVESSLRAPRVPRLRDVSQKGARGAPTGSAPRVLVVVDDAGVLAEVEGTLGRAGYEVDLAPDAVTAIALFGRRRPDLVITDQRARKMPEWELVRWLRHRDGALPIIVLGEADDRLTAVTAMREGAQDYMLKPLDSAELSASVQRVLRSAPELARTEAPAPDSQDGALLSEFGGLIGTSVPMQKVYRIAATVARSKASLLISGETGTGKGKLASAIHDASERRDKPFVTAQATAFAENLLESELFGHERGSFTGAEHRRIGRFEQAHQGTLFLDEIGEMSPAVQVKLLRVLQEKTFERVGGNDTIAVDVRVIAATSRDLRAEVLARRFREDLYYRLNVVRIEMPPLRVRAEDILLLANSVLERRAAENAKRIEGFTSRAKSQLLGHAWAGNVRELENTVERAVVMCDGSLVDAHHLELETSQCRLPLQRFADIEREAILSTLAAVTTTARAAEVLGISVRTIHYRLKQYGLTGQRRRMR